MIYLKFYQNFYQNFILPKLSQKLPNFTKSKLIYQIWSHCKVVTKARREIHKPPIPGGGATFQAPLSKIFEKSRLKDDIQSDLRMCGKYCLWGAQTNHINVNYMKYLGHY